MTNLEKCFLIHSEPFGEQQLKLTLLGAELGCRTMYAHMKHNQPSFFQLLEIESRDRETNQIQVTRALDQMVSLQGQALYLGLYLNELVYRLAKGHQVSQSLFGSYFSTLRILATNQDPQPSLRYFERQFLADLGYGLDYLKDLNQRSIQAESRYDYLIGHGFRLNNDSGTLPGEILIAIMQNDWRKPETLKLAKHINRQEIQRLLGNQPLNSRKFFT